jgi:signal transduction histidine kinase/DNA-binding response OmpR family regulator/ligand-binding sensor domain-containing protein
MFSLCLPLSAQEKLLPVLHFQKVPGFTTTVYSNVARDSLGYVWFGTVNGLMRYDGYGLKEYRHVENDPSSIVSNLVLWLFCDSKKRLWVGTGDGKVCLYDRFHDRFLTFPSYEEIYSKTKIVNTGSFVEESNGNMWFASYGAIVRAILPSRFGPAEFDSLARYTQFTAIPIPTRRHVAVGLTARQDGKLVAGTDSGLIVIDPATLTVSRPLYNDPFSRRLDSISVYTFYMESDSTVWIGTGTEGLFHFNWNQGTAANYRHREGDAGTIRLDEVLSIMPDRRGNLWVSTIKGYDLFSLNEKHCIPYLVFGSAPGGGICQRISVDNGGTYWLVDDSGVFWLSPRSFMLPHYAQKKADGRLRSYQSVERDRNGAIWCLSDGILLQVDVASMKVIRSIDVWLGKRPIYSEGGDRTISLIDRHGDFWFAGWDLGLHRVNLSTSRITTYSYPPSVGVTQSVRSIAQGPGDSLWIGTNWDGLWLFDPQRNALTLPPVDSTDEVIVTCASDGTLYLSTVGEGLVVYSPATGRTARLLHNASDPRSLADNMVRMAYEDPSGRIWVSAGSILDLWDPSNGSFEHYSNRAFDKALFAHSMGSDPKGRVWLRYTPMGSSLFDPTYKSFKNLDFSCGMAGASTDLQILDDGRVLLTGNAGVNIFHSDSLRYTREPPPLVITQLRVNDTLVIPLPLVDGSRILRFSHDQNVIEFLFAAIDIDAPQLVEYSYRLDGLEPSWIKPVDRRYVRYPGLTPGDYKFSVRVTSVWGEWQEREISFAFSISPPWWRSLWAYICYILIASALLISIYRARLNQLRLKQRAEMEHFQAEHLAEVDSMKSRFFANVSHEFRTPLTLILGPVETALSTPLDERVRETFILVKRNAQKLHALVNQLLEFTRIEAGNMKLSVGEGDLARFLQRVVQSFQSWAERKRIRLEFRSDQESITGYFDAEKLEKIINNLVSNALKFTPEGGTVNLNIRTHPPTPLLPANSSGIFDLQREGGVRALSSAKSIMISVSDTGPGISPEHLPHVFDRFYRVDESHKTEGTGIGLALTKELVELHHGTISVQSEIDKGTTFTVTISIDRGSYRDEEICSMPPEPGEEPGVPVSEGDTPASLLGVSDSPTDGGMPVVLVVEDNADVRAYIRSHLDKEFAVLEAENGRKGFEKSGEVLPDLVVSDIMMPEMDGYELTRALKHDEKTSHIPVILLTARAASESKIEGLETGADDYLTKPFDAEELVVRIRNLIEIRRELRKKFSVGTVLKPGEVSVPSMDDALLKRIMEKVEENMGDEGFGVEELTRLVALSRRQLQRKILSLTNLSPGGFIRYMRLQRAHALLQKNAAPVAEIGYQVGFSSPAHFSSAFHRQFGIPPSEVRRLAE